MPFDYEKKAKDDDKDNDAIDAALNAEPEKDPVDDEPTQKDEPAAQTDESGDEPAQAHVEPKEGAQSGDEPKRHYPEVARPSVHADDLDAEIDSAIQDIEADELMTSGQKRAEIVRLKAVKDDRASRKRQTERDDDERAWNTEAQRRGRTRDELQAIWNEETAKLQKKYPNADIRVAQLERYNERVEALAKKVAAAPPAGTVVAKKPAAQSVARDGAGRFSGPGIAPGSTSGKGTTVRRSNDPDKKFDAEIARIYND